MIIIKSQHEVDTMRAAGRIVAECHAALAERVKPGVTTAELDTYVERLIVKQGATPSFKGHQGFPASICVAINDVVCHGIPSRDVLNDGDVITIDIGAYFRGFHGDSAWSYAVGDVSPQIKRQMEVTLECLKLGIAQAVVGKRIGDIGYTIQQYAEQNGFGVVRDYTGHGVGRKLWESPPIPHVGTPGTKAPIRVGMTLAIEPMLTAGDWRTKLDADGWTARTLDGSICVQYEHTIAVTEDGPIILTQL